jgi:hypothetical protein
MDTISESDARELASLLSDLAGALDHYRFAEWNNIPSEKRQTMQIDAEDIRSYVNRLIKKSIGLTINDMKGTMRSLGDATKWLQNSINILDVLDKAIAIGAAAVEVAAAAATANPAALGTAVSDFLNVAKL